MSRAVLLWPGLVLLALAATACGRPDASHGAGAQRVDEFGDPVLQPPTREEILAAPAEHEPDLVVDVLLELVEDADPASLPAVLALRNDPREEVRWHVVEALHAIGGAAAREALADMAANDESALVRDAAGEKR